MGLTATQFLEMVKFESLVKLARISDLERLKQRLKKEVCNGRKCKCQHTSLYYCHPCKRVHQTMCRAYHVEDPFEELVVRLAYEFMFGMLKAQELAGGQWACSGGKDPGHCYRLVKLKVAARRQLDMGLCPWLM